MPLQEQFVDLPFAGSIDEKTRAELLMPPNFAVVQNLVQNKHGALTKAPGNTSIAPNNIDGSSFSAARRIISFNDELNVAEAGGLHSYSPTTGKYVTRGVIEQPLPTRIPVAPIASIPNSMDVAYANGYYVIAWTLPNTQTLDTNGSVLTAIVDATTYSVLKAGAAPSSSTISTAAAGLISLVTVGNIVILIGINASTGTTLSAYKLDCTSASTINTGWASIGNIVTDYAGTAAGNFDCMSGASQFYVIYPNNSTSNLALRAVNTSGSALGTSNFDSYSSTAYMGIGGLDSDAIWIAWRKDGGTNLNVQTYNSSLSSTASAVTHNRGIYTGTAFGVGRTGSGTASVIWGNAGVLPNWCTIWALSLSGGVISTVGSINQSAGHIFRTRPYGSPVSNRAYAAMSYLYNVSTSNPAQDIVGVMELSSQSFVNIGSALRPAMVVAPRLSAWYPSTSNPAGVGNVLCPMHVAPGSTSTRFGFLNIVRRQADVELSSSFRGALELVIADHGGTTNWIPAPVPEGIALSGGAPLLYDGSRVYEVGFFHAPEVDSTSTTGMSGGPNGTYEYVAVYEQADTSGYIHRSAPSQPTKVVTGGAVTSVTVNVTTLQSTMRNNVNGVSAGADNLLPVRIALYRTLDSGTTYYYVTSALSNPNNSYIGIVDSNADSAISSNTLLYTNGGAQPRVCPPALSLVVSHKGRLFGVADDGITIWYSGQAVIGEAVWFADIFQMPVIDGGPITGLASMDGHLIVLKRSNVFVIDGDGPADDGSGNDYSQPQRIPVDIGCIEPRSVVVTSEGVWFQSLRGLELLSRSLQVEDFAGQQAEDTLASYPIVKSAVVDEQVGRVYFVCRAAESAAASTILMRDMIHKTWSQMPYSSTTYSPRTAGLVGTTTKNKPYFAWGQDGGTVLTETLSSFEDNSTGSAVYVGGTIQTAPIHVAGIAGFQRVREIHLLMQYVTAHDLNVYIDYDNAGTFSETHTFTNATLSALTTSREILRIHPKQQKCRSIALKIQDVTPSSGSIGTGQGPVYLGLRLRLAVKTGSARLPAANQQ